MKKRILSFGLCVIMLVTALLSMTACKEGLGSSVLTTDAKAQTLVLAAIKADGTTDEGIKGVEDALNIITEADYNTHIVLKLFTADEYAEKIFEISGKLKEKQLAFEEELENMSASQISKLPTDPRVYNNVDKDGNYLAPNGSKYPTYTVENGDLVYNDEFGRPVTIYPTPSEDQIDIVFIDSDKTYQKLVSNEYIISLASDFTKTEDNSLGAILRKYINANMMDRLTDIGGEKKIFAVPNNYVIDEFKYVLVNKKLYDYYRYDINCDINHVDANNKGGADDFTDFIFFMQDVMRDNGKGGKLEELGMNVDKILYNFTRLDFESYFGSDGDKALLSIISTPTFGYDSVHSVDSFFGRTFVKRAYSFLFDLKKAGYAPHINESNSCFYKGTKDEIGYDAPAADFEDNKESFALAMVSGDKEVTNFYNKDDYYVVRVGAPIIDNRMFNSMFAVSTFSSTALNQEGRYLREKVGLYDEQANPRCFEIIGMLQTSREAVNLLTYGLVDKDYEIYDNDPLVYNTGKGNYKPVVGLMGNLFLTDGYDGMDSRLAYYSANDWKAAKAQSRDAVLSPFCGFMMVDGEEYDKDEKLPTCSEIEAELGALYDELMEELKNFDGKDKDGKEISFDQFMKDLNKRIVKSQVYNYATQPEKSLSDEDIAEGKATYKTLPFAQYTKFFYLIRDDTQDA